MSDSPISDLIRKAREKTTRVGSETTVHAKDCTCYVEISRFSVGGSREHYSRCVDHRLPR